MLKLNASYSKKVPAGTEYSSQSYHAQIEIELPDGLSQQQLHEKVHNVFEFVRSSVENELQNTQPQAAVLPPPSLPPVQSQRQQASEQAQPRRKRSDDGPATGKQINYLMSLLKRSGWTVQQLLQHCRLNAVEQISSKLCSQLIEQFSGQAA